MDAQYTLPAGIIFMVVYCTGPVCQYTIPVLMQSSILLHSEYFLSPLFQVTRSSAQPNFTPHVHDIKVCAYPRCSLRFKHRSSQTEHTGPVKNYPGGVVLTRCAAMKGKSYFVDEILR